MKNWLLFTANTGDLIKSTTEYFMYNSMDFKSEI